MAKRKKRSDPFADLTWDDLEEWAERRIVSRGQAYQRQGRVSELAVASDGGLVAWVDGSRRYATKVVMDEDGVPDSVCTCPYQSNCKHGVAVVLEYLEQVQANRSIPKADKDDDRVVLLEGVGSDNTLDEARAGLPEPVRMEIEPFLQDKSKAQLAELLLDLAEQHPDIAQDLVDRRQIASGSEKTVISRLRKEIRQIADHPGWQDYWHGGGYTVNCSEIRRKLDSLLEAGHADEVLSLGRELLIAGTLAVEQSDDEGETRDEVAACMPVVAKALDRSSLSPAAKLAWAVEAVLKDDYDLCSSFAEYLHRRHPKEAWNALADQLLTRLNAMTPAKGRDEFSRNFARDRLSDWAIRALQQAGRTDEILPLCEAEVRKTDSYERLVEWLIRKHRYEEAERWIREGIQATEKKLPGIAQALRSRLKTIRAAQKDVPALAALEIVEFVQSPAQATLAHCEKVCRRIDVWPQVRGHLLAYLESGTLPWKQKGWPLPAPDLEVSGPSYRQSFPLLDVLIDIAIHEKDPQRVLHWYDQRPRKRSGWWIADEDRIASAVEAYAPDRAVAIWRSQAESLIAQVKPRAYEEAAKYLRKAGAVMAREGKQQQWAQYLKDLRQTHARKSRLIQVLDKLSAKPIAAKRSRGLPRAT